MPQNQSKQNKSPSEAGSIYGRYLTIAYKMIALILICCFIGIKLDAWSGFSPLFTVIMLLIGVVGAMYLIIKNV
ncbi:MAG: AtpZ/AtpI family protein [Sphingobacteriales bacterium]|nr:MAG: AtpZ/AtpI family protein [Sphingobacteriales bacterium]